MVNQNYEFDTGLFSAEEAKQAQQGIFSDEAKTFEELQSRPWYKTLLVQLHSIIATKRWH